MRWTPAQVLASSMLGGPLAGFLLLGLQAQAGADGRLVGASSRVHVTLGIVAQLVLLLAGVFAQDGFPRGGLAAAGVVVPWSLARQAAASGEPDAGAGPETRGGPLGWGRVLGLGVACGIATIVVGVGLSVLSTIVRLSRG